MTPGPTNAAARLERATGALVGSVVGDALGAPFEFGPPDAFTGCYLERVLLDPNEMRAAARPKDIGIQTTMVLGSGRGWRDAAADHFASSGHATGNGSLMRTVPAALFFAAAGRDATMDAARRISALTHGDPAAGEGCATYHELICIALDGADPLDHVGEVIDLVAVEHREAWAKRLDPTYDPRDDTVGNGAVWPALGSALWALRTTNSFEGALRAAVDLGHDTDTVACITGGLAGARYSIGAIPSRWTTRLNGQLIGWADSGLGLEDLESMARSLVSGRRESPGEPVVEHVVEPTLVWDDDLIYAASFPGVASAVDAGRLAPDTLVVSLSLTFGRLEDHEARRQMWMLDQDGPGRNLAIQTVLDDVIGTIGAAVDRGQTVVVHCHGGRSRTGLVLRAWLLSRNMSMTVTEATAEVAKRWRHLDTWNAAFDNALELWIERWR